MLITLEGIEGSGKTTQIAHMAGYLREWGRDVVLTREPGGTLLGRQIRAVLLDPENSGMHPVTELLLYAADRAQHVRELIAPMLAAGKTVICDRFCDATTVYQGFARGLEMPLIRQLNEVALGGLLPDVTFLLDLPPKEGLRRAWAQISSGSRPAAETRFESETLVFHEKVRAGYLSLARAFPDRFVVVDASADPEAVKKRILSHLEKIVHTGNPPVPAGH